MTVFRFVGCMELSEILGRRARDERELMEGLEQVPPESVFYHAQTVFLRHAQITRPYPNDFANWVASQIRDHVLAEQLGMVDPFRFLTLEDLREELISIIADHIAPLQPVPRVVFGDPFFFVQSHIVEVPAGLEAGTLAEFRRCLAEVDASALYLHGLHARGQRAAAGGDFARWIADDLGLTTLGEDIARINPYLGGLEALRTQMLRVVDAHLAAQAPAGDTW